MYSLDIAEQYYFSSKVSYITLPFQLFYLMGGSTVRRWRAEQIPTKAAEVRCNAQQPLFKDNEHPSPSSHYEANNQWH